MITKNFKAVLGCLFSNMDSAYIRPNYGRVKVQDVNGQFYYMCQSISPTFTGTTTLNATAPGISVGTGTTPATENDYQLENTITSGITLTVADVYEDPDEMNNPRTVYKLNITNNGAETITVGEVGIKYNCPTYPTLGQTKSNQTLMSSMLLLDRTVLSTPVTIAPGDAGIIDYTLQTTLNPAKTVNGVKIVSWENGSDADVAAMIDAAQAGTINLQTDGGWSIGDMRRINIAAFTGGGNTSHAAQEVAIIISSFADYNSCGCVMQFDFQTVLAEAEKMNSTDTNNGGYGSSLIYTTTLPALVTALPNWLQTRLKTFSVLVTEGNQSSIIETITDNKLALRSRVEIDGTTESEQVDESSQIALYAYSLSWKKFIISATGKLSSGNIWWLRSPKLTNKQAFHVITAGGSVNYAGASGAAAIAPFGCV